MWCAEAGAAGRGGKSTASPLQAEKKEHQEKSTDGYTETKSWERGLSNMMASELYPRASGEPMKDFKEKNEGSPFGFWKDHSGKIKERDDRMKQKLKTPDQTRGTQTLLLQHATVGREAPNLPILCIPTFQPHNKNRMGTQIICSVSFVRGKFLHTYDHNLKNNQLTLFQNTLISPEL